MSKWIWTMVLAVAAALPVQAHPARADEAEPAYRQQIQEATWPADIVRLSDDYLRRYPNHPQAAQVRQVRANAAEALQALNRNDVRLYRSAFASDTRAPREDLRLAALADKEAAVRLAHAQPQNDLESASRYVGWLQFASMLGSAQASYDLALYYRKQGQPAMASRYEERAVDLGFTPPRWLDHVRK